MNKSLSGVSLFVVVFSVSIMNCGGLTNKHRKNSELVGAVFSSSKALFYIEGCENEDSCGNSRIERRVNRVLVCENRHPDIAALYKRPYKRDIEADIYFTVKSVVDIGCWGIECTFGGGVKTVVVLKDSNEITSLKALDSIDPKKQDVCE